MNVVLQGAQAGAKYVPALLKAVQDRLPAAYNALAPALSAPAKAGGAPQDPMKIAATLAREPNGVAISSLLQRMASKGVPADFIRSVMTPLTDEDVAVLNSVFMQALTTQVAALDARVPDVEGPVGAKLAQHHINTVVRATGGFIRDANDLVSFVVAMSALDLKAISAAYKDALGSPRPTEVMVAAGLPRLNDEARAKLSL